MRHPESLGAVPSTEKAAGFEPVEAETAADAGAGATALTEVQREMVEICAHIVQQLGLPRSVGQIYGVIYASPRPLAFADVVAYLGISNGSASQGLRFLRELGAVHAVEGGEGRRELFKPETELRRLLGGVLQHRFRNPLEAGVEKLNMLQGKIGPEDSVHREFIEQRLGSLQVWHRKALHLLPLLQTFLGKGRRKI